MAVNRISHNIMSHQSGETEPLDLKTLEGNASAPESSSPAHGSQDDKASDIKRSITGYRWLLVCLATFSANLLYGKMLICLPAANEYI